MTKYIKCFKEVIKGHLLGRMTPISVTISITSRCNLRCKYCYIDWGKKQREFTTSELLSLIDEVSRMGARYISLSGGEALLRDDLEILVDKIKERGMLCHISTNGIRIRERIEILRKVDTIGISLDGGEKSNDINRGKGIFKKVIEGIECLVENGIKFHTHTVLNQCNKEAVEEMIELAGKYGFKAQFSPIRLEDSFDKEIGLTNRELREFIRKIIEYKKLNYPVFFSSKAYENLLTWEFGYDKPFINGTNFGWIGVAENYKFIKCYVKRFSCHIEANGLVYPCIVLVNKFKAMNFLEVGFKKAYENLRNNDCKACYNICCNEFNLVYGLDLNALWSVFKTIIKK